MSVIEQVAQLTAPWAHLYNGSRLVSTGVVFVHLAGLLLGGGFAIAADRTTLRMLRANTAIKRIHLGELRSIHRPVVIGLTLTLLSGLLMLGADVETFLPAPLFWIKMALIVVLLGNGMVLQRTETRLRRGTPRADLAWKRLAGSARASLALWFGALLLGTALLAA